jgi:hypothetical protein
MTTTNQHKQGKSKPYNKGFKNGAEYAWVEYKQMIHYIIKELYTQVSTVGFEKDIESTVHLILDYVETAKDKNLELQWSPIVLHEKGNRI